MLIEDLSKFIHDESICTTKPKSISKAIYWELQILDTKKGWLIKFGI